MNKHEPTKLQKRIWALTGGPRYCWDCGCYLGAGGEHIKGHWFCRRCADGIEEA
jgi:hypothetical protein